MMYYEPQQCNDDGNGKDERTGADGTLGMRDKVGLNITLKLPARGDLGKDGPIRLQKLIIQKEEMDIGYFDEDKERISDDSYVYRLRR